MTENPEDNNGQRKQARRGERLRYDSGMAASATNQMFEVECPCCGSTLQIDPETHAVILHHEPEKKPLIEDLQSAVQQLKGEAARRNDVFEKSFATHLSGEKVRERKFDELLKQAKEDKTVGPPKRPFDLD